MNPWGCYQYLTLDTLQVKQAFVGWLRDTPTVHNTVSKGKLNADYEQTYE